VSTSANLDLVRSIYAAWERGDFSSVEWADPEIEYRMEEVFSSSTLTGPSAMAQATRGWMAAWRGMRFEADEYRELDDERVLVMFCFKGHGKASGLALDAIHSTGAHLFRVRSGKVTVLVAYFDRDRALADLGLKE
jgi:ketosteroid isomerase-like protein